jgi:hypothetical protein
MRPVFGSPARGRAGPPRRWRWRWLAGTAPGGARASLASRQPRPLRPRSPGSMIVVDSILISYCSYHDHGRGARLRGWPPPPEDGRDNGWGWRSG